MADTNNSGSISIHKENKIATITFFHPSGNSFPSALLNQLTQILQDVSSDKDILVIVLKSKGEGPFCAGASFDELVAINDLDSGKKFFSGFANVINAMRKSPQVIIGRIHGKTVGGGVGLAAACDYAMATHKSLAKLSELTIGIGPFVIAAAVERKIGKNRFAQMSLEATQWKEASWCETNHLYTKVFDDVEKMDHEIEVLSHQLAQYNPEAIFEMKRLFWEDTDHWDELLLKRAEISGKLVLSDFTKKALSAFKK